ncbi:AMP-binding protein [Saccharopolyspora pogona]|uniref:AMP-binding protein n=1 Tax=Saccharopolyspora pogona TaxID=333966 RepID=UPI0016872C56|nr:class I adenylate-forming enzyme family protein [Saccharopolyspora pogona]
MNLAPETALRHYFGQADAPQGGWSVRWDALSASQREAVLSREVPEVVTVRTSGSTGVPTQWSHSREQMLAEAAMLAELWREDPVDLMLAFAPPTHLYGLLTTLLMPAVLGVEVWYQPGPEAPMPDVRGRVLGITAIPWTFRLLDRRRDELARASRIVIQHSTATLPPGAEDFANAFGRGRVRITEIFGSTESGGIAHRAGRDQPWTLFPDITLTHTADGAQPEVPLVVSGPRLAAGLDTWATGDFVEIVDPRHFRFHGRRTRLRKINGVRVDFDEVEYRLRDTVPSKDVACVPVDDPVRGENFTVLVVPDEPGAPDVVKAVRIALKSWNLVPHEVLVVPAIERSETGKLRR